MTLKDGKTGMTLRVDSIGESGLKERLMTMGMLPGTKIKVLRSAPWEILLQLACVLTIWLFVVRMQSRFR